MYLTGRSSYNLVSSTQEVYYRMLLKRAVHGLLSLSLVSAVPAMVKRDDMYSSARSFSTSIASVSTDAPTATASSVADVATNKLWSQFWDEDSDLWSGSSNNVITPHLWEVAVAGNVVCSQDNSTRREAGVSAIRKYFNSQTGGYSATTPSNSDIYTDDDSQAMWAFTSAYQGDRSDTYMNYATDLMDYIMRYNNTQRGGMTWSVNGDYIASISTVEASLAAVKLYMQNSDENLISFAKYEMKWLFDHFIDYNDGFIVDGMNGDGSINGGKLIYTIGAAISTAAFLSNVDDELDWKAIAVEFGVRAMGAGQFNTPFYSNGYISNSLQYSHNFYTGIADLLQNTMPTSIFQTEAYRLFRRALAREGRHLYDQYYQSDVNTDSAPNSLTSLLDFSSLAQSFYDIARVVDEF